jgi:hypothetical protein
VVAAAVGLHQTGFAMPLSPSMPTVLVFAAESVVSLETKLAALGKDFRLTGLGETLRLLLRVAGPVLLALAVLAVRNRVKR